MHLKRVALCRQVCGLRSGLRGVRARLLQRGVEREDVARLRAALLAVHLAGLRIAARIRQRCFRCSHPLPLCSQLLFKPPAALAQRAGARRQRLLLRGGRVALATQRGQLLGSCRPLPGRDLVRSLRLHAANLLAQHADLCVPLLQAALQRLHCRLSCLIGRFCGSQPVFEFLCLLLCRLQGFFRSCMRCLAVLQPLLQLRQLLIGAAALLQGCLQLTLGVRGSVQPALQLGNVLLRRLLLLLQGGLQLLPRSGLGAGLQLGNLLLQGALLLQSCLQLPTQLLTDCLGRLCSTGCLCEGSC
jgi:hypothetical protein